MSDTRTGPTTRAAEPRAPSPAQPIRVLDIGETRYTVLGTAHVSKVSADEVERLMETGDFDAVAIELDPSRHANLTDPDRFAKMDLFQVLREGKAGMVAASLALGAFQQRLADQMGIEPGAEFRVAIRAAKHADLPVLLIDRDIGVTLRRLYRNVPWWRRTVLMSGLLASVLSREEVSAEEIEKLKEGDMLEATFTEFAETSQSVYEPLIAERDRYMAARLRQETSEHPYRHVLVVIGAGHLKGLVAHLQDPGPQDPAVELSALDTVPPPSPWTRALPWIIIGLFVLGFAIGFSRSSDLGWLLIGQWVLLNGGLGALGALVALAHPLTILSTFVMAPVASLHPLVGIGMIAAGVELWLKRPQVGDFERLRQDVTTVRGWWRNRVARIFLVFVLSQLGAALGNLLALVRIPWLLG